MSQPDGPADGRPDGAPSGRRVSGRRHVADSLADMVRSVGVLLGLVVVVVVLAQLVYSQDADPRPTVDWREPLAQARESGSFAVWAPDDLPDGWRATTVSFEPGERGRWHLGVQTDDDEYVGLEVSPVSADRLVERYAPDTRADGEVSVGGQTWTRRRGDGETTLVRDADGTTVLVTGTAPASEIVDYAASLTTG